jgi:hypothetical protein
MKNFLKAAGMMLALSGLVVACGDPCEDVACGTGGTCVDGDCVCETGYENGTDGACIEVRAKMIGNYNVTEDCAGTASGYISVVGNNAEVTKININNFFDSFSNPVVATVDGNTLTIAEQEPDGDNYLVEGTGAFTDGATDADDKITLTFTVKEVDDTGSVLQTASCTATFDKN